MVGCRHLWPNRDPIQELGGNNLYCYINNEPCGRIDSFGLLAELELVEVATCVESSSSLGPQVVAGTVVFVVTFGLASKVGDYIGTKCIYDSQKEVKHPPLPCKKHKNDGNP